MIKMTQEKFDLLVDGMGHRIVDVHGKTVMGKLCIVFVCTDWTYAYSIHTGMRMLVWPTK